VTAPEKPCEAWKGTPDDWILLSRCKVHDRAISQCDLHALVRALEEERDAIKQFAAEEVVRHSATIRERDGLRALLEWFIRIDSAYFTGAELAEHLEKVRAALDGEGKKARR